MTKAPRPRSRQPRDWLRYQRLQFAYAPIGQCRSPVAENRLDSLRKCTGGHQSLAKTWKQQWAEFRRHFGRKSVQVIGEQSGGIVQPLSCDHVARVAYHDANTVELQPLEYSHRGTNSRTPCSGITEFPELDGGEQSPAYLHLVNPVLIGHGY